MTEKIKTIRPRLDADEVNLISIALNVLEQIDPSEWKDLLLKKRRVWSWQEYVGLGENTIMEVDRLFKLENISLTKLESVAERFRLFGLEFSPQWWSYKRYEEKRQKPYYPRPRR